MTPEKPSKTNSPATQSNLEINQPIIIEKTGLKPGYKTTEFYKSSALEIIALLAAFGVVGPEDTKILNHMPDAIAGLMEALFRVAGLATALISQWGYNKNRTIVKKKQP